MPETILTREEVLTKLKDWQTGTLSSRELHAWAEALYLRDEVDYEDWEGDHSVTNEIIAALDMLDMNLILPEDAPIYIEFLATPPDGFKVGYQRYQAQLNSINLEKRQTQLVRDPLYAPFFKKRS